jgi:uncharacterized membrane protein
MTNRLLAIMLAGASLISVAVTAGCSDDASTGGDNCDTVKGYAELSSAFSKCTNCHSSALTGAARNAAPVGTDYDTYDLAKPNAQKIFDRVSDGTMPQPGYPQFQGTEKQDMLDWASCGAPP